MQEKWSILGGKVTRQQLWGGREVDKRQEGSILGGPATQRWFSMPAFSRSRSRPRSRPRLLSGLAKQMQAALSLKALVIAVTLGVRLNATEHLP